QRSREPLEMIDDESVEDEALLGVHVDAYLRSPVPVQVGHDGIQEVGALLSQWQGDRSAGLQAASIAPVERPMSRKMGVAAGVRVRADQDVIPAVIVEITRGHE